MRSTKIKTFDGMEVAIPNSKVDEGVVENYMHYNMKRYDIALDIDPRTDVEKAKKAIFTAIGKLQSKKLIIKDQAPIVYADSFDNLGIRLKDRKSVV